MHSSYKALGFGLRLHPLKHTFPPHYFRKPSAICSFQTSMAQGLGFLPIFMGRTLPTLLSLQLLESQKLQVDSKTLGTHGLPHQISFLVCQWSWKIVWNIRVYIAWLGFNDWEYCNVFRARQGASDKPESTDHFHDRIWVPFQHTMMAVMGRLRTKLIKNLGCVQFFGQAPYIQRGTQESASGPLRSGTFTVPKPILQADLAHVQFMSVSCSIWV